MEVVLSLWCSWRITSERLKRSQLILCALKQHSNNSAVLFWINLPSWDDKNTGITPGLVDNKWIQPRMKYCFFHRWPETTLPKPQFSQLTPCNGAISNVRTCNGSRMVIEYQSLRESPLHVNPCICKDFKGRDQFIYFHMYFTRVRMYRRECDWILWG